MTDAADYKIELEQFAGPLDLLLFLVRKEEVEVEALPLARITEQYLRFVDALPIVDLDRAGDFIVMAAQLLEWKARALLPAHVASAAAGAEEEARARTELVKDLLEYRELKERARLLEDRAEEASKRYGRTSPRTIEEAPSLKNVDLWDLVTAFQRLEKEIGALVPERVVAEDEAPLALFVERVRARLAAALAAGATGVPFRALFETALSTEPGAPQGPTRSELVATFLALLELVRLGEARARQSGAFGEIEIVPERPEGAARA